eukprot:gene4832-6771_t
MSSTSTAIKTIKSLDKELHNSVIKKKERKLYVTQEKISELNDSISKISSQLKSKRESEKSLRVSTMRNIAHTKSIQLDATKRAPDRMNDIRTYSKMDLDIWKHNEVRDWFNKNASESTPYTASPSQTGYMISIE